MKRAITNQKNGTLTGRFAGAGGYFGSWEGCDGHFMAKRWVYFRAFAGDAPFDKSRIT